jgi:hypothetical protein
VSVSASALVLVLVSVLPGAKRLLSETVTE